MARNKPCANAPPEPGHASAGSIHGCLFHLLHPGGGAATAVFLQDAARDIGAAAVAAGVDHFVRRLLPLAGEFDFGRAGWAEVKNGCFFAVGVKSGPFSLVWMNRLLFSHTSYALRATKKHFGNQGFSKYLLRNVIAPKMNSKSCPNCGAMVPSKSKACPECGSDESTGWSDNAHIGGLNLPDEQFDYDEFARREFGENKRLPHPEKWFWWIVALLLVSLFLWGGFRWLF